MEINRFKNTLWKKIIHFNQEIKNIDGTFNTDQIDTIETVNVSWFPNKIDLYSINRLNSKFSKIFYGENRNSVEILVDREKEEILSIILVKVDENGNILEVVENPLLIKKQDFSKINQLELLFDEVNKEILNKHHTDIGYLKIIDKNFWEETNVLDINNLNNSGKYLLEWLENRVLLLKEVFRNNSLKIYPEPPINAFFNNIISAFNISLDIRPYLEKIMESGNISITLKDSDWYKTFIFEKKSQNHEVELKSCPIFEFGLISKEENNVFNNLLKRIASRNLRNLGVKRNFIIDIDWIVDLISNLVESEFPITENRIKYILQKFLFGLKNIGDFWDAIPRSSIYHEGMRFLLRIFGFHVNLRKLSYWSLPDAISLILKKNFGVNYNLLILIGDNKFSSREDIADIPKGINEVKPFILKVSNSKFQNISEINKNDILDAITISSSSSDNRKLQKEESNYENKAKIMESKFQDVLQEIYRNVGDKFDYLNGIIFFDENLLLRLLTFLIIGIHSRNPFAFLKLINLVRECKDSLKFWMYPHIPQFQYFRKTSSLKLVKQLNSVLFDFKEF